MRLLKILRLLSALICLILFESCLSNTEVCEGTDLGLILLSDESLNALPVNYLDNEQLVFVNSVGEEKVFTGEFAREVVSRDYILFCNNVYEERIRNTYSHEYYNGKFRSDDSLLISINFEARAEDCLSVRLNEGITVDRIYLVFYDERKDIQDRNLGSMGLVTNNVEVVRLNDQCDDWNSKLNEIELAEEGFDDVFTSIDFDGSHDVFFKIGEGVLGFIDQFGKSWKRK